MQGSHRKNAVVAVPPTQRSGTPNLVPKGSSARQTPRENSSGIIEIGGPSHTPPTMAAGAIPRKVNVPIVGAGTLAGQSAAAGQRKSPVPGNLRRSPVSTIVERNEPSKSSKQPTSKTRTFLTQGISDATSKRGVATQPMPGSAGTPRALSRDVNLNPTVIVNPNFDFAVRHQPSSVSKSYGEDGPQRESFDPSTHRLSPAAADSSRRTTHAGASARRGGGLVHGSGMHHRGSDDSRSKFSHFAWSSLDSGLTSLHNAIPEDVIDDDQIETAIRLLQPHKDLQQDQVLQDLLRMIRKRIQNNRQAQRTHTPAGEDINETGVDRFVSTSDSSTQVRTVEASSQTELCEFKEKKIRPKRVKDGHSLSYSDSDVPSDTTESRGELSGGQFGRPRRRSLGIDSVSLSTNSPREMIDDDPEPYSRELSDASGPTTSVHSVLMSAASSTDISSSATLPNLDTLVTDRDSTEELRPVQFSSNQSTPCRAKDVSSSSQAHIQKAAKGAKKEIEVQVEDQESEDEGDWMPEDEFRDYGRAFGKFTNPTSNSSRYREGGSPPPCVETILEMHLLLEQMYRKAGVTGPVLYPPILGAACDGQPVRPLCRINGIFSPATAEMRRLTLESMYLCDDPSAPIRSFDTPERPPNPAGFNEQSPSQGGKVITADPCSSPHFISSHDIHRIKPTKVRMGNSPPKHACLVPPLSIPNAQPSPRHTPRPSTRASVESPLSTPREGSAFLAHINSARSSANGSDGSTPRLLAMAAQQHHQYHEGMNPHHGHVHALGYRARVTSSTSRGAEVKANGATASVSTSTQASR